MNFLASIYNFLERFVGPFALVAARLKVADIFWSSGLQKLQSWQTTVLLYKNMYKVPFLPPELAAYLTVAVELSCPIFLAFGLLTRLAAIPMFIMTLVIYYVLPSDTPIYWFLLLSIIICYGPGPLSIDQLMMKFKPIFKKI